jgi:nucleoid-associated protein YgaU
MKKMLVTAGIITAVVLVSGCRSTNVAGVTRSQEEQNWEQIIQRNYPGYRAPRAAAPANFDNTEERTSFVAKPAQPEAAQDPEAAPETLPEVTKTDVPAETPAVEAAKTETPAETPQTATPKVETPAVETAEPAVPAQTSAVQPPDPTSGKVYVVKPGDTLGKIALKHYGKAAYSNLIFKANSDILKNPDQLRPGMKLIVPQL